MPQAATMEPSTATALGGEAAAKKEIRLEIKNLTKRYPAAAAKGFHPFKNKKEDTPGYITALDRVSFSLTPGLYGLLGPNGAGKSTLLNIITGSLAPEGGSVQWCGKPAQRLGRKFRAILGYMPQQQGLYDNFTGRRFLQYLCALKELPRADTAEEVARVAAAVHLQGELDKRLAAYSGGMKQRLLAASCLLGSPQLMILDEPTAGFDPKERVRLRTMLAGLAKERIVLVATHVVSDVESVADGIILLKKGRIADMAPPAELIRRHAPEGGLEDVYLNIFGEEE